MLTPFNICLMGQNMKLFHVVKPKKTMLIFSKIRHPIMMYLKSPKCLISLYVDSRLPSPPLAHCLMGAVVPGHTSSSKRYAKRLILEMDQTSLDKRYS